MGARLGVTNATDGERRDALRCPRCGYDQGGIVATWSEKCPLEGTCSECGLVFAWADLFVPPRCVGLVEHARGFREWVWNGVRTFFGVWRPRAFWSWLKLEHPLRLGLARTWLLCACVIGVIGVPLLWRMLRFRMVRSAGSLQGDWQIELEWWGGLKWVTWILPGNLEESFSFLSLGSSRRSDQGVGGLDSAWYRIANTRTWFSSDHAWWALPLMVMCSISPAVFVLAPWTRARAKVRLGHVGRWWVYGQGWVVALFCWQMVILMLGLVQWWVLTPFVPGVTTAASISRLYRWIGKVPAPMESKVIVPAIWFLWLMWWNGCALRTGMRLSAGLVIRIWVLLMGVTVLIGIAVVLAQEVWLGIVVPREF